ncbi:hypothetical protein POM88_031389 [Heracleum sosnowskyi]|uniref:Transmembrane protein n=1 Tax=Heracleum sosnowskyi TaxID=360622 RepID=A0AAD8MJ31_9APIA|nr:hypothetical protein POM88_031389 [Heracleum sosnowskyi]
MASVHGPTLIILLVVSSFWFSTLGSLDSVLQIYGLPRGLFPDKVKGYSIDQNMVLEIELEKPCLAMFESFVFYEKVVRANLSEGKLLGIHGLSNKELFIWLPVKAIVVNYPDIGIVMFDITVANKTLSLSHFDQPPSCQSEGHMQLKPKNGGNKVQGLGSNSRFSRVKEVVSSILNNYF